MSALDTEPMRALKTWRGAFWGVGIFSALINALTLTGAFYMLQIYDRVVPSQSVPTLVGLSVLAACLFAIHGLFEVVRSRILLRIGRSFDQQLRHRVFSVITRLPLSRSAGVQGLQPLRDLDQVRGFFSQGGPIAFFDLPWLPVYVAICFFFHPLIGYSAVFGALTLASLTLLVEGLSQKALKDAANQGVVRNNLAEASRRNAEVLAAMGMTNRIADIWNGHSEQHAAAHCRASDIAGTIGGISRVFRISLQSAVLGLAAYLAIHGEASAGIIIASSIVAARALAPVDTVIGHWKSFVSARQSWQRLANVLREFPEEEEVIALRPPKDLLSVEHLSVVPPGSQQQVIRDVSFDLRAGSALGVIGPTAAGKTSLARALAGIWTPARGKVRLDGAALDQWSQSALGCHIGYLPQDIELFDGTVGQNIARFDSDASAEAIISAAEAAGVHQMILGLPEGYATQVGQGGQALSGGQRQRIALARALYGEPFLVVLDEPNANLDADGEQALALAIASVRKRGGVAVVIAHRPSALAATDYVLMMKDGMVQAFGPQKDVLRKVLRSVGEPATATVGIPS